MRKVTIHTKSIDHMSDSELQEYAEQLKREGFSEAAKFIQKEYEFRQRGK